MGIKTEKEYKIRIFWAGDSRAAIQRKENNNEFECLTTDHKPNDNSEKQRIIKAGGFVQDNRVVMFCFFFVGFHAVLE